jgi:hypothetical protein
MADVGKGLGQAINELLHVRERWAQVTNEALREAQLSAQVDHVAWRYKASIASRVRISVEQCSKWSSWLQDERRRTLARGIPAARGGASGEVRREPTDVSQKRRRDTPPSAGELVADAGTCKADCGRAKNESRPGRRPLSMIPRLAFASCYVYSPAGSATVSRHSRLLRELLKAADARFIDKYARRVQQQVDGGSTALRGVDTGIYRHRGHTRAGSG